MTMWNYLDLRHPDMRPPLGQAVVVRTGSLSFAKDATYRVGYFAMDPREPDARKLWFYRSGGGIEDPARWKKYYTDIRFMPLDTPEGGVVCG